MSNHLRHCPKHRKPLPCPHCAVATPIVQLPTIPGFVSTSLPHEYESYKGVWVCIHCSRNDHSATPSPDVCSKRNIAIANQTSTGKELDKKIAERERRAKAAVARRKKNADQRAAIKEALRIPAAVRLAEEKEKQLQKKLEDKAQQSAGAACFSNHYQTGGGKELSGGDYLKEKLRKADAKEELDFGGRRVTPEGVGQRPGIRGDGSPDKDSCPNPWTPRAQEAAVNKLKKPIIQGAVFSVKLADKDWTKSPAYECIPDFFIEVLPLRYQIRCTKCGAAQDDEQTVAEDCFTCWQCLAPHDGDEMSYVCRLCGDLSEGKKGAACHMSDIHGGEKKDSPNLDQRFGNVLQRWLRGGKKPPNIEKAHRKVKAEVTA
jgi:hypothetical protein